MEHQKLCTIASKYTFNFYMPYNMGNRIYIFHMTTDAQKHYLQQLVSQVGLNQPVVQSDVK